MKNSLKEYPVHFLLIIIILVTLNLAGKIRIPEDTEASHFQGDIFIELSGDIKAPGVYSFLSPPSLDDLLVRGGLTDIEREVIPASADIAYDSGSKITFVNEEMRIYVIADEMSAFFKITLGIPLSLNSETEEGLTAVPGIGPKTAALIVEEREKRGGFTEIGSLLSIPGVGPSTYRKIKPFLTL